MATIAVVKHLNVIDDPLPGLVTIPEAGRNDTVIFQSAEEALGNGIGPAISLPAHAASHTMNLQHPLKIGAAILAPLVGVKD